MESGAGWELEEYVFITIMNRSGQETRVLLWAAFSHFRQLRLAQEIKTFSKGF